MNVLHVKWNLVQLLYISHFLCYHKYTKIQNNIHEKNYYWWTSCRSCWSGQRFSSTSHLMFSIAVHRGKISLNTPHIPCNDQLWCPHMQHSCIQHRHLILCFMIIYFPPPFSKHGSECAVSNLHIYMLPNFIGYSKWLIQIVLQLEVICQFSRHYKQCQCQIFMEYTCVHQFLIIERIVLNVMDYTMKNDWEVVKSLTV